MKALLALSVLFMAFAAQANVKPIGTLEPMQCAENVDSESGVTSVCLAQRIGMEGQYLQIMVPGKNGRTQPLALEIVSIQPGNSGITGTLRSLIVTLAEDDMRFVVRGTGSPGDIESLTGDMFGYDFKASDFQVVMHTL
jgi:hypothetical protein